MCYQKLILLALAFGFAGTAILAVLGVSGVTINRNGSISLGPARQPPTEETARKKWGQRRYWAYRLGLPIGLAVILVSFVVQAIALYAPQCTPL